MRKKDELNNDELSFYLSLDEPDKKLFLKNGSVDYSRRMNKALKKIPDRFFKGFYNPKPLLNAGSTVSMIVSKRADGKTYGMLAVIWFAFQFFDYPSVYMRRLSESLKPSAIGQLFDNILNNPNVPNPKGYDGVTYRSGAFRGYWLEDGKKKTYDEPFCYTMSLNAGETSKGTKDIRNVFMVLFDEFLSRDRYLPNEFLLWNNAMSTIGRLNPYTQFVMLGNPVSWESPYFLEYNIGDVKKMPRGVHTFVDSGNDFVLSLHMVEESKGATATAKINSRFFPSSNNSLRAIVHGEWEMNIYPHIIWDNDFDKCLESNIYFLTDNDLIQIELFEHRLTDDEKPTNTRYDSKMVYCSFHKCNSFDLKKGAFVYTTTPQTPNDSILIRHSSDGLYKMLFDYEWFFDTNETGEIVRNFLQNFTNKKYLL